MHILLLNGLRIRRHDLACLGEHQRRRRGSAALRTAPRAVHPEYRRADPKESKNKVDKHQKEYLLREQLKVIREELGEDTTFSDADEFEEACSKLDAPEEVKEKLHKEIGRFKNTIGSQAENGVIRTYIETILEMPWNKRAEDNTDINYAKEVLEADHYGLEQVKERILEFLAVRTLTQKGESPILCLV